MNKIYIGLLVIFLAQNNNSFGQSNIIDSVIFNTCLINIDNPILVTIKEKGGNYFRFITSEDTFVYEKKIKNPEEYINQNQNLLLFIGNCKFGSLKHLKQQSALDSLILKSYEICESWATNVFISQRIREDKNITIDKLSSNCFLVGVINVAFYNNWFIERYTSSERLLLNTNTFIPFATPLQW